MKAIPSIYLNGLIADSQPEPNFFMQLWANACFKQLWATAFFKQLQAQSCLKTLLLKVAKIAVAQSCLETTVAQSCLKTQLLKVAKKHRCSKWLKVSQGCLKLLKVA
jgi:hypothetical protein